VNPPHFEFLPDSFCPILKISIDEKATIADLAQEVAGTIGEEQVKLEVGDGFELRNQE
jgi:hypothetical protein